MRFFMLPPCPPAGCRAVRESIMLIPLARSMEVAHGSLALELASPSGLSATDAAAA